MGKKEDANHAEEKRETRKERRKIGEWLKNHKLMVTLGICVMILLLFFGAKSWLYFQFLLGNDIIIKVTPDKDYLRLLHGEEENVTFTVDAKTNAFCKAVCFVQFEDLSRGASNPVENFSIQTGIPVKKTYRIQTPPYGEGHLLYRFDIICQGKQSILCHTKEEATTRNILVMISYERNVYDDILREKLLPELNGLAKTITATANMLTESKRISKRIDSLSMGEKFQRSLETLQKNVTQQIAALETLQEAWYAERYQTVKEEYISLIPRASSQESQAEEIFTNLSSIVSQYNELIKQLNLASQWLGELEQLSFLHKEQAQEVKQEIEDFFLVQEFVSQQTSLEQKKLLVDYIVNKTRETYRDMPSAIRYEAMTKNVQQDVDYELLCRLNISCGERSLQSVIIERANQTVVDPKKVCNEIIQLHELYKSITTNRTNLTKNQTGIPETNETVITNNLLFTTTKKEILQEYLEGLPEDRLNSPMLQEIITGELKRTEFTLQDIEVLEKTTENTTNETSEESLEALFIKNQPLACENVTTILPALEPKPGEMVVLPERIDPLLNLSFSLPQAQCCIFKKCDACCTDTNCQNDPQTSPLVFLHGHALSSETAADYSLDIFNSLQEELEQEGYINGGAISLTSSSSETIPPLSVFTVPVTLKASYYLDLFQEQEDYVIVQTKSENIDTYAIRFKELIDTVQQRTGKPKVIIITHSMGGLVARRYIQIFGSEKVAKLILVGTPNKGIRGDVAKYCTVFGGEFECRDMNANSLFMNKLNREKIPSIPIYTIVGTGCSMDGQQGDGIVLEEDALLDGAQTTFINGTCEGLNVLHTELLKIEDYPEVYAAIKEALAE